MSILLNPDLESRLRARAQAEGLSVEAYLDQLLKAEQQAEEEIEALALEGIRSGEPITPGPDFWESIHRELDERLKSTAGK